MEVGNNGGQLPKASIEVRVSGTKKLLPIVVQEKDVDEALLAEDDGVEPEEVSGWSKKRRRIKLPRELAEEMKPDFALHVERRAER